MAHEIPGRATRTDSKFARPGRATAPQLDLGLTKTPPSERTGARAGYKSNGALGYKPLVTYADGTSTVPVAMHCRSPEAARAVAQAFIDAGRA